MVDTILACIVPMRPARQPANPPHLCEVDGAQRWRDEAQPHHLLIHWGDGGARAMRSHLQVFKARRR